MVGDRAPWAPHTVRTLGFSILHGDCCRLGILDLLGGSLTISGETARLGRLSEETWYKFFTSFQSEMKEVDFRVTISNLETNSIRSSWII